MTYKDKGSYESSPPWKRLLYMLDVCECNYALTYVDASIQSKCVALFDIWGGYGQ